MDRKEVKRTLKASCRCYLQELLEDVGFTKDEANLFKYRYFPEFDYSVPILCMKLNVSPSKINDLHNNILDKIISHLSYRK